MNTAEHKATQALISMAFIDAELAETRAQISTLDGLIRAIRQLKDDEGKRILNRASDHCSSQLLISSTRDPLAMSDYAHACQFIQDHVKANFGGAQ